MSDMSSPVPDDQEPTNPRPESGPTQPQSDSQSGSNPSSVEPAMPPPSGAPAAPDNPQASSAASEPFATTVFPAASADGVPATGADGDAAADQGQVWRDQYLGERKKARLFMVTTAVAVVLLGASLFYTVAQTGSDPVATPLAGQSPGLGGDGQGFRPPGGGIGPGDRGGLIQRFFNSDGSVDEEAVAQFTERAAQFGGTRFGDRLAGGIGAAVANGDITSEQAGELLAALGIDSAGAGA